MTMHLFTSTSGLLIGHLILSLCVLILGFNIGYHYARKDTAFREQMESIVNGLIIHWPVSILAVLWVIAITGWAVQ